MHYYNSNCTALGSPNGMVNLQTRSVRYSPIHSLICNEWILRSSYGTRGNLVAGTHLRYKKVRTLSILATVPIEDSYVCRP